MSEFGKNKMAAFSAGVKDKQNHNPQQPEQVPNAGTPENVEPAETQGSQTEPPVATPPETPPNVPERVDLQKEPEGLSDESILSYLKEKHNIDVDSFEKLKNPEPVSDPVDPFSGLDEETKKYLEYKRDVGGSYNDFLELQKDYSQMSPLELARLKVSREVDSSLTPNEIDQYLEKKLGIDIGDEGFEGLSKLEAVEVREYTNSFQKDLIENQKKYAQPSMNRQQSSEELQKQQEEFTAALQGVIDNMNDTAVKVKFDDNGNEVVRDYAYNFSKEEKHKMVSDAKDIGAAFENYFVTEKGADMQGVVEAMAWANPQSRNKMLAALIHKAVAENTEELLKSRANVNFETPSQMPRPPKNGEVTAETFGVRKQKYTLPAFFNKKN